MLKLKQILLSTAMLHISSMALTISRRTLLKAYTHKSIIHFLPNNHTTANNLVRLFSLARSSFFPLALSLFSTFLFFCSSNFNFFKYSILGFNFRINSIYYEYEYHSNNNKVRAK